MSIWLTAAILAVTILVGALLLGWLASRLPPRTKKSFAVASALFLSFGVFNPNQDRIVEAREDEEYAKRQNAGDPPEPHGDD